MGICWCVEVEDTLNSLKENVLNNLNRIYGYLG